MSIASLGEQSNRLPSSSCELTDALAQLRLKLLDLSGRNRLINFKHTAGKSLQFVQGQPADIYQKLVEANNKSSISIIGLPEAPRHEWVQRNGRLQRPEPKDWAKTRGISLSYDIQPGGGRESQHNVRALMYPDDLAKHCRKIEREAVLAIEETGANMLFLVLGFLDFPDQRDSDRIFTAPLVSIPVTLLKKEVGGVQAFSLQFTGDDIAENLSLREKLKKDYGLILPDLDEDQIDVEQYLANINQIIKNHPGFTLRRRVSLCLLSFTNMLLVRDLDPTKWPQSRDKNGLVDHPLIRQIFEGCPGEEAPGLGFAVEHPVEEGPGAAIPLVYDADSSQHSALIDVLAYKKNLVIEGPPGTGKSQTITNLIGACLAEGKKVLFVAEKMAALEVVKNRLTMAGLDPFVLELHSNKTNKKRVLEEIGKRITFKPNYPTDLPRSIQLLESYRSDLKAYADLINAVINNAFGLTLHQVMWRAEKHRSSLSREDSHLTQLAIPDATEISEFELSRRMDSLGHLSAQYQCIGSFDTDAAFWGFFPDRIVPGDEIRLKDLFSSARHWAQNLVNDAQALSRLLDGAVSGMSLEVAKTHAGILRAFTEDNASDLPLHLVPRIFENDRSGEKSKQVLVDLDRQIQRFHALLPAVQAALKPEAAVEQSRLDGLTKLMRTAEGFGVTLGNPGELVSLSENLHHSVSKLVASVAKAKEFAAVKGIVFDGTRLKLKQLEVITELIIEAPEEHLHLQCAGLTRDDAVPAVAALSQLQTHWTSLLKELEESLYLDTLPPEGDIKQAIRVLREGDAWYRIFQGRWRSAVSLHRSLQRTKRKIPGAARLAQLEQVLELLNLKDRWKVDPTWLRVLGTPAPFAPEPLNGFVRLAEWNYATRLALEEVQSTFIDLASFTPDQARGLRREFAPLKQELVTANLALGRIDTEFKRLHEFTGTNLLDNAVVRVQSFINELGGQLEWLGLAARSHSTCAEVIASCEAFLEREEIQSCIGRNSDAIRLLGDRFAGAETDVSAVLQALALGQEIEGLKLSRQMKDCLLHKHPFEACREIKALLDQVATGLSKVAELGKELEKFGAFDQSTWIGKDPADNLHDFAVVLTSRLENAVEHTDLLIPWSLYVARRAETRQLGLSGFVDLLESKLLTSSDLSEAYAYCTYGTIIRAAFRHNPKLGAFSGLKHNQTRDEFKRLDKEIIHLRGRAIAAQCAAAASPPGGRNGTKVDNKTEMVLLNYLLPQQRPRMPVRKMLLRAGASVQTLKPCFMMGPQAVAQYLTPGAIKFDLVIMDEASQLKPEEAIGAIARGGQLVVVGDPKQLPPTSFFSRMSDGNSDDDQFTTTDAESILDVCSAHFRPTRALRWHYRSQHHSLIAFSNHHFYRGNLVIFPSPYGQSGKLGVRATYLADAIYENQTNMREVKRVVDAVVDHIVHRSEESLGVVTLNIKQRDLIAELIEERLKSVREADAYRAKWLTAGQPLFVKNLENVQGDERDAIIISTTFGKPVGSTAVRQNFGPISRQGGWRRLNVLFTRAKKSIAIFTSMRPEDIVVDGKTPEGTRALRNYLEYAQTGLLTVSEETGREPDSDFEISVMDMLRSRGYEVTPQLGVAGYRIDLAVKHPDSPGSYLAAIECDGASYHSALSVRDRDRIRQEILESLGWRGRIWRIWSTDWFRTPGQESEKLISFIENLRQTWKPEHTSGASWVSEGSVPAGLEQETVATKQTVEEEREAISSVLIDSEDDLEVEVGDLVRYVDIEKPDNIRTVQITADKDDFANGLISESRPLAQTLLGAVLGDEVTLHLPGAMPRVFRVTEIKRILPHH